MSTSSVLVLLVAWLLVAVLGQDVCPSFDGHGYLSFHGNTTPALTVGTTATLSCYPHFGAVDDVAVAHCVEGRIWDPQPLRCEKICLYLPPGDFLHQSSMSRYPGAQVIFSCIEGHVLEGASSTTCHNGTWSNEIPTCVDALCPYFPSIPHLHYLHIPSRHINTTVFLECETGWRLIGSAAVTCQPNQTWSPELPHCEAFVCPSFNISHGTFTFENNSTQDLVPGTRVTIDCDDGYGPVNGSHSAVCQANTYTWYPITPGCDKLCPHIPASPGLHLSVTNSNYYPKTVVYFSCEPSGSHLVGNSVIQCLSGGEWSSTPPHCENIPNNNVSEVSCPVTLDKGHFTVNGSDNNNVPPGTPAILNCAEVLTAFNGIYNYTCSRSGTWIPEPGCGYSCPAIISIHGNLLVNTSDTFPNTVVSLTCVDGTFVHGNSVLSCLPNTGRWNFNPPKCSQVPTEPPNPQSVSLGVIMGSAVGGGVLILAIIIGLGAAILFKLKYKRSTVVYTSLSDEEGDDLANTQDLCTLKSSSKTLF